MQHLKKILLLQYFYLTTPFQRQTCNSCFLKESNNKILRVFHHLTACEHTWKVSHL